MELQTKVEFGKPGLEVGYDSKIMLLGSCFAENIGEKLKYFRFQADVNPCGIVYNPASAAGVLRLLLDRKLFTADDLLLNDGKWVSLYHHGSFSSDDRAECLRRINERLEISAGWLEQTDLLVITLGTSWVYRYRETGQVASNCHKIPAIAFERFRLEVMEIVDEYMALVQRLRELNPGIKLLFTVSPIRHWKDGAHGNQLSKAVLMLAIDELVSRLEHVYYFPAYEIVMDELRDYRFYTEDMLHISPLGINYIWERFQEFCVRPECTDLMKRVDKVNKGRQHRASDIDAGHYRVFQERLKQEEEEVEKLLLNCR